jgi:alkylhydroperoxidase family enzyme
VFALERLLMQLPLLREVRLRNLGWLEHQIAEAVYIIAMFAFFNRVADAFGLEPMGYLEFGKVTK